MGLFLRPNVVVLWHGLAIAFAAILFLTAQNDLKNFVIALMFLTAMNAFLSMFAFSVAHPEVQLSWRCSSVALEFVLGIFTAILAVRINVILAVFYIFAQLLHLLPLCNCCDNCVE